jgi:DNA-binding Xre family transcriptional regulator
LFLISNIGNTPPANEKPIKEYQIKKGVSLKELAKILEIDPTILSRIEWEKGKRINKVIKERLNYLFLTKT